jgi:peroxiredoxin
MEQTINDTSPPPASGTTQPSRVFTPSLLVVLVVAAMVIGGALFVLLRNSSTEPATAAIDDLAFLTDDGSTATLADYRGKPLVVNFFASWCPPCRAEMPDLEEVHLDAGDRVTFLGISHDSDESAWRSFIAESEVTFPTVFQPEQEIYQALELFGMPSTVLIDADGQIVHAKTGIVTNESLRALIADHLGVAM